MNESAFHCPSQSVICRKVNEELMVIPLRSGKVYYFSPEVEEFLNFFRSPRRLSEFQRAIRVESLPEEEIQYLNQFVKKLLSLDIFRVETQPQREEPLPESQTYSRPRFLREGDFSEAEFHFL